jgi:Family of unknown function (DUF5709)
MPDDETYEAEAGGYQRGGDAYEPGEDGLEDTTLEDDGVLEPEDALDADPGDDPLDQGVIPPDRWSAGERYGTTLAEERAGEPLDQMLAEEEPDIDPYAEETEDPEAGLPAEGTDAWDEPAPRAGRLVAEDEGAHPALERDLVARDAGVDGGAAGAEEAAVHVEDENENPAVRG